MSEQSKAEGAQVTEGRATVLLPRGVFYNPVQEFNRDLTVAAICSFQRLHENKWYEKANKSESKKGDGASGDKDGTNEPSDDTKYPGITILEALAASGLRSTRFALEIPKVRQIVANDIDPSAAELIATNAEANGEDAQKLIKATCKDANLLMMEHRYRKELFDVIDLDPYGSAAKFIPAAMMSIADGGLLCVTCTDSAVLCGSAAGTAFGRYGGVAVRCSASHELGLRVLLHALQHHAAVEGRYIEPLASLSADFYKRVFVRVLRGPGRAKLAPCRSAMAFICTGCDSIFMQPLGRAEERPGGNVVVAPARGPPTGPACEQCGGGLQVAGPMWADRLHDGAVLAQIIRELRGPSADQAQTGAGTSSAGEDAASAPRLDGAFAKASLKTRDRIVGVLSLMAEELPDCPLYYRAEHLSRAVHCHVPGMIRLRSAILNSGYRVSSTHIDPMAFKTDAPPGVLWDIMRAWVKKFSPVADSHLENPKSVTSRILSKEATLDVNFDEHPLANPESRKEGLLRFQPNPEKDWGPKARAKRGLSEAEVETMTEKRTRLQGKRAAEKVSEDDSKTD